MEFKLSLKKTLICLTLAFGMAAASVWQWNRHIQKQELIKTLQTTLKSEVVDLAQLIQSDLQTAPDWRQHIWRRIRVSGTYDFSHEVIVRRNRGSNDQAGFHVVTPLKIASSENYILVDRGFIPLGRQEREYRKRYQSPHHADIYGIIKESSVAKFLGPKDPDAALDRPWIDLWIRINTSALQRQLPYPILPIYIEVMEDPNDPFLVNKIVKEGSAGRNDVLALTGQKQVQNFGLDSPDLAYPIAHFDTTPPPDIHLGYVYEWAFMALLTIGIGVIAQFKRPTGANRSQSLDNP
jgi:surfeit locus 1 family protein